jgi:hypothetical protein
MRKHALAAALLLLAAVAASAQPRVLHANISRAPAARDLAAQVRGASTSWVGYSVPAVEGERVMCCFEDFGNFRSGGTCRLSDDSSSFSNVDKDDIHPAATSFAVLLRVTGGAIDKVRSFSQECTLDASNTSITWIDGVDPRASVALLSSLVTGDGTLSKRAMSALALHADPSAGTRLEQWTRGGNADELRGEAVFWLAETRPDRGFEAARSMLRDAGSSRKVREKAIFALSQIGTPAAIDEMIRVAHDDSDSHTRGQALFWLSQKAGKKASAAIRDAVDNDPNEETREKAVFAVSQMPDNESIPMLIDLLKHHKSAGVRKKAAFWLGQKRDPRALQALEDILKQ